MMSAVRNPSRNTWIAVAIGVGVHVLIAFVAPGFILLPLMAACVFLLVCAVVTVMRSGKMIERKDGRRKLRTFDWPKRRF